MLRTRIRTVAQRSLHQPSHVRRAVVLSHTSPFSTSSSSSLLNHVGAAASSTISWPSNDDTPRNDARGTRARWALATAAASPLVWRQPSMYTPAFQRAAFAVATRTYNTSSSSNANEPVTVAPVSPAEAALAKKRIAAARRRRSKIKAQEEKLVSALEKGGERQLLRVDELNQEIPKLPERVLSLAKRAPQLTVNGVKALARGLQLVVTDPAAVKAWFSKIWDKVKAEAKHYWLGTKLLYADVTTSTRIVRRLLRGNALSRRERKQLQRTVADLLRLVPFAFFVIVPFMELLLPVALKMFPNMLPSTYKDSFQREEDMKRQLQLRVSLAEFLQETVKEVMQDTRDTEGVTEERKATASEVMNFIERAQRGEPVAADETLKVATLFNDELMLDNISRPQLVAMCRYMGVGHYGNDNILRFTLRNRIRQLKKDDQDIIWEGLDSLDKEELQQACMERGMRATGLTKAGYMRQMRQWLDLSINKNVPTSLLIMSRALNITATDSPEAALATSLSSMDEELVTEVALSASATPGKESTEMRELKLESIRYQNEMIADEEKFRTEAKKKADEEAAAAAAAVAQAEATSAAEAAAQPSTSSADQLPMAGTEPVFAAAAAVGLPQDSTVAANAAAAAAAAAAATSTPTPPAAPKTIEHIVSVEELSALESLAFKSIVEKERQAVDQMKQNKSEMDVEGLLAAGRIGTQTRENKTAGRMLKRLDMMLSNLEQELEKVDRDVGDKLNILDRDSDGVMTAEELKHAVMTILRKSNTEEDVEWLVSKIDQDKDGKVSLDELTSWTAKCRELLEATGQIHLELDEQVGVVPVVAADTNADATAKATVKRSSSRKN